MSDDKRLERIEQKLDATNTHLSSIDITLAGQAVSLAEHIRRTSLLEDDMKPVKKHVDMVNGALKFIGALSILIAVYEFIQHSL